MAETLLKGSGITQRWGGLVAVNQVSIALERGTVHAVIGTNGAGKSTLINILSGEFPPPKARLNYWVKKPLIGHKPNVPVKV